MSACQAEDRGFKSRRSRQSQTRILVPAQYVLCKEGSRLVRCAAESLPAETDLLRTGQFLFVYGPAGTLCSGERPCRCTDHVGLTLAVPAWFLRAAKLRGARRTRVTSCSSLPLARTRFRGLLLFVLRQSISCELVPGRFSLERLGLFFCRRTIVPGVGLTVSCSDYGRGKPWALFVRTPQLAKIRRVFRLGWIIFRVVNSSIWTCSMKASIVGSLCLTIPSIFSGQTP
jgi:hypothetical protein